jgi:hypothetical protein
MQGEAFNLTAENWLTIEQLKVVIQGTHGTPPFL